MGHECLTDPEVGLAGKKNGELLRKNIRHQQNLLGRTIAVVIIKAKSSEIDDLLPHTPACLTALESW
jgi:hypothetical protein